MLNVRSGVVLSWIGDIEEVAGFGQVGNDDVRFAAELGHLLDKFRRETGVQRTVVCHGWVDQNQIFRCLELVKELGDDLQLPEGAQVAGVDGIHRHALCLPVGGDGEDLIGQIAEGEAIKCCVGGQHRRGDNCCLYAAGGDDRQSHRQGAFADAGDVLDGHDPFQCRFPPSQPA